MSAPARDRWILLNVLRLFGIVMAAIGLLIWRKGIGGYQDEMIGRVIFLIGVFEMLLVPALLRRKWRSEARGRDEADR